MLGGAMFVQDLDPVHNVNPPADIEAVLSKRYRSEVNSFWLADGAGAFPAINVMVNGSLAYVHYFPKEPHPGYASVGGTLGLNPEEDTAFFHDNTKEKFQIMNEAVVPFSDALKAAQEFAVSKSIPKCIQWNEL
jgi:hypothetical protein